jgi:hypothetical protein
VKRQIFINCPFDKDYWPLMQALVFAVHACGFAPRCVLLQSKRLEATEITFIDWSRLIGEWLKRDAG